MNVFRYFKPVFLLCVFQLLVEFPCQGETHLGQSIEKSSVKNPIPRKNGRKNRQGSVLNRGKASKDIAGKSTSSPRKHTDSLGSSENDHDRGGLSKGHYISHKEDVPVHIATKADDKFTKPSARSHHTEKSREPKDKTAANGSSKRRLTHSKKSKLTNNSTPIKPDYFHPKGNTKKKKKKLFKKYALVQSFSPLQAQSVDYQPIATGGQEALAAGYSPLTEGDQTGDVKDQDPSQQQQQISDGNSISQYDSAGYQQDSSQSGVANFVNNNGEDVGQSDGRQQPISLEQAIQLQQEAYSQQPQEQGQEQDNARPGTEGVDLGGQASQVINGGQLQYQSEEASQSQEQGANEGAPEQGGSQTGLDQGEFQQGQTQELNQQQSQGFDEQLQQQQQQQQQQDQATEYQQQQQQPSEESQESEAASSETQSFTTSTNSLGSLFGTEGQQTTAEQQGQGTVTYANEQPGEGGDKSGPPGIQYASSIEEALKEPSESPQDNSSEEGDGQNLAASDGANVISISGGSDSRESSNNGFIAAGTVSAPSGYQTAAIDDNGNTDQAVTGTEVNGYAPMNDQGTNGDATASEENQETQSATSADSQNSINFAGQQLQQAGLGEKMPSLDDDFNKIVDIANKNGPMAVKGCKGCPPHARCIDKVCIINDDQPLAHILNALSGPEPGEESPPSECKECHYNAKCIQRECVCKAGYTGDGFDCRPDTCLPGCKQHGKCIKGFCVCDHHHYFNGYECAPYKITHRSCSLQCATRCHAGCPPNCCKHHRVLKIHYNDGNPPEINIPPNELPQKNATAPRPTVVVLKPEGKVNEHVANFASEFQQRPADSETTNLEAVNLKNPTGGFAISEMAARPLVDDDAECPAQCKSECRDSCPVRCCVGKCPFSCLENCQPSCPKTCCHFPGSKHPIPMMDPQVQENFMKTMAEKFCPRACKAKCNPNCPPICCEGNSTHPATLENADIQKLKGESKNSADFFRNAMSWFGMMNFLNMMYNMYGNLYGTKRFDKFPIKANDHKIKPVNPTKPKTVSTESHFNIKEVGVAESLDKANNLCPDYCNKTCLHICPTKCCRYKPEGKTLIKVGNPLKCQPSCALYCSKICPPLCCSKNTTSSLTDHHPTEPIKIAKSSPVSSPPRTQAPTSSLPKPPAACTPICPAYCYPKCLENCCQRGEVTSKKLSQQPVAPDKAKQSYNNFFAEEPPLTSQDCPSVCRRDCGPSCPLRCCGRTVASPTPTRLVATHPSINTPLCPGGCASECFPACTISCCRAGFRKEHPTANVPAVSPTRRERQPGPNPPSFRIPLPPPAAVCHSGCSRSCYPNCDETCCKAYLERASGLSDPNKLVGSSHFTIKVPCPSECRPFNCLYYCHHDCCLPRSGSAELKKRRYQDQRKYLSDTKKIKAPTKPMLDKNTGGRISNRRTVIHKRPTN